MVDKVLGEASPVWLSSRKFYLLWTVWSSEAPEAVGRNPGSKNTLQDPRSVWGFGIKSQGKESQFKLQILTCYSQRFLRKK